MSIVAVPARYNPSRGYWGSSSGFVQESQASGIIHRELVYIFVVAKQVLLLFRDSGLVPKSLKLCQFCCVKHECSSCCVFTGPSPPKRKLELIDLVIPRSSQSGPDEINVATPFAQLP